MRTLVRYNPHSLSLFDDVDRMFRNLFAGDGAVARPRVDIREDDSGYVLEAEFAGMNEKDIEVKVEDNLLHLSAAHDEDSEDKGKGYVVRERRAARYSRSFVLPKDITAYVTVFIDGYYPVQESIVLHETRVEDWMLIQP